MTEEKNGNGKNNGENPNETESEYENFQNLLKQVLSVSKEEMDKGQLEERQERQAR